MSYASDQAAAIERCVALTVSAMREAALAGAMSPTNGDLCRVLGVSSVATGARYVALAVKRGLIVVQYGRRGTNSRVVSAPDGSWSTRTPEYVYRSEPAKRAAQAVAIVTKRPMVISAAKPPIVDDQAAGERALADRIEIARKLLAKRVDEDQVARTSGIPLREVFRIRGEMRRAA